MSTTEELWAATWSKVAKQTNACPDPEIIIGAIRASVEPYAGLRAANYEARIRGSRGASHPERMEGKLEEADPEEVRWARTHETTVRLAKVDYIDAIGCLSALCLDGGTPDDWDEAVHWTHLLDEMGYVTAALDVETAGVIEAIEEARVAINKLGSLARRFVAHEATQTEAIAARDHCRSCARFDITTKRRTKVLCQWCYRQVEDLAALGDPVLLQLDPDMWPPEPMCRSHADGRAVDTSAHRRDWLVSLGLDPIQVHNRRQSRRVKSHACN